MSNKAIKKAVKSLKNGHVPTKGRFILNPDGTVTEVPNE